jgi:hypothetical protein
VGKVPVFNANVHLKNTEIGSATDENGYFMLRHSGESNTLVVSCVGLKTQEIKIEKQLSGITVEMTEDAFTLSDIFVVPGANPALELMRKVRLMRGENNITQKKEYSANATVQSAIFIDKINKANTNRRIFEQLKTGSLSQNDTALIVPIFMSENRKFFSSKEVRNIDENVFSSNPATENIVRYLTNQISEEINFYKNNVILFDKSMISPLSSEANFYYKYYLIDSLTISDLKLYELRFYSKNKKNLAFSGTMKIDSATLALTEISAELPRQANINFVNGLYISQKFSLQNEKWLPETEVVSVRMTYELLADSTNSKPEVFINRGTAFSQNNVEENLKQNFAESGYNIKTIEQKLEVQNNTPIMKAAIWLTDVVLTGYIPVGIFDFGKMQYLARLNDEEGFRLTLPVRTNEKLWENVSIGGHFGYGFGNKSISYQGFANYKLPSEHFRVLGASYTRDYRKIDYKYNNFLFRENPWLSGDEDIATSLLLLKSTSKLNRRHEFELSFFNEWNKDFESKLFFRSNKIFLENTAENVLATNSFTLSNRLSFGERTYNDHVQRIYFANNKPVIYCILEGGKFDFNGDNGFYGKVSAITRHNVQTSLGRFRYIFEAGKVFGNVPYPLLESPTGTDGSGYSFHRFGLMNRMEYAADTYTQLHTEMMFNGILMNQIPLIKHLNIREIMQFKAAYGFLNENNNQNFPEGLTAMNKPYAEVGAGLSNILRCLSVQYVWRLSDLQKEGIRKGGLQIALLVVF